MCIRRRKIDHLWPMWELQIGEYGDDGWPPEEVGHCND
jgi:hypothetical protein